MTEGTVTWNVYAGKKQNFTFEDVEDLKVFFPNHIRI